MPLVNKASAAEIYFDGATVPVQVFLTGPEAVAVYGAASVAGWYAASLTEESGFTEENETEEVRTEGNVVVRRVPKKRDAKITATLLQTGGKVYDLHRLLQETPHKYRVLYPTSEGKVLLVGLRHAFCSSPLAGSGKAGEKRTLGVEYTGTKAPNGDRALEIHEVETASETTWPAAAAPFKTDVAV